MAPDTSPVLLSERVTSVDALRDILGAPEAPALRKQIAHLKDEHRAALAGG